VIKTFDDQHRCFVDRCTFRRHVWPILVSDNSYSASLWTTPGCPQVPKRFQRSTSMFVRAAGGRTQPTHRYTHCERTPKVSPRPSRLQSNSEKRFGSSVGSVGVQAPPSALLTSTPPSSRFGDLSLHLLATLTSRVVCAKMKNELPKGSSMTGGGLPSTLLGFAEF
jgi:hypothetical protein